MKATETRRVHLYSTTVKAAAKKLMDHALHGDNDLYKFRDFLGNGIIKKGKFIKVTITVEEIEENGDK